LIPAQNPTIAADGPGCSGLSPVATLSRQFSVAGFDGDLRQIANTLGAEGGGMGRVTGEHPRTSTQ
jgi:hypothetical protein